MAPAARTRPSKPIGSEAGMTARIETFPLVGRAQCPQVLEPPGLLQAGEAEHVGERLVGEQQLVLAVDHDALQRGLDQVAEALLAFPQCPIGLLARCKSD